jgi:hypothetical protein
LRPRLFADHGAAITFHGGIVRGEQLSRDRSLQFIFGSNAHQRGESRSEFLFAGVLIGMLKPERFNGLVRKNVVPMIRLRSAEVFQGALHGLGIIGNNFRGRRVRARFLCAHRCVLSAGDRVRITRGVFAGVPALYAGKRLRERITALLTLLGAIRPVVVKQGDIEAV